MELLSMVVRNSIEVSIATVLALAFARVLRGRVSARFRRLLWAGLAALFLLPFRPDFKLPVLTVNTPNAVQNVAQNVAKIAERAAELLDEPVSEATIAPAMPAVPTVGAPSEDVGSVAAVMHAAEVGGAVGAEYTYAAPRRLNLADIAVGVWIAGFAAVLLTRILRLARFRRMVLPSSCLVPLAADAYAVYIVDEKDGLFGRESFVSRVEVEVLDNNGVECAIKPNDALDGDDVNIVRYTSRPLDNGTVVAVNP